MSLLRALATGLTALVLSACATGAAPVAPAASQAPVALTPYVQGEKSPDVPYFDMAGNRHLLSEHQGKMVVLIYFAHYCPVCQKELPMLQQFQAQNAGAGVDVVAIEATGAGPDVVKAFAERTGTTMPLYYDTTRAGATAYSIQNFPNAFLLTPDMVVKEDVKGAASLEFYKQRAKLYAPNP